MGFIDVEQYIRVALLKRHNLSEFSLVAIHAKDRLGHDTDILIRVCVCCQERCQVLHIVVAIA